MLQNTSALANATGIVGGGATSGSGSNPMVVFIFALFGLCARPLRPVFCFLRM